MGPHRQLVPSQNAPKTAARAAPSKQAKQLKCSALTLFERILKDDIVAIREILLSCSSHMSAAVGRAKSARSRKLPGSHRPVLSAAASNALDINAVLPQLGMTPLILAVTLNRYLVSEALLDCPVVNVNVQDVENGWTALHKALYLGNMRIACLILQKRKDTVDFRIEDHERNTPHDLFHLTIDGSAPNMKTVSIIFQKPRQLTEGMFTDVDITIDQHTEDCISTIVSLGNDIYTWGDNANFTLGHSHSRSDTHPKRVILPGEDHISDMKTGFVRRSVQTLAMSKMHTAILASTGELYTCGLGNSGRLGSSNETQLRPRLVETVPNEVVSVAVGRDHTIIATAQGHVWVWGSNQFGQCGFPVTENEPKSAQLSLQPRFSMSGSSKGALNDARLIMAPRLLATGPLKREKMNRVAASKFHSIAYNASRLITFGLNCGQLGHLQTVTTADTFEVIAPRQATILPNGRIQQVVTTEWSTCVLLGNAELIIMENYTYRRVAFAMPTPDPRSIGSSRIRLGQKVEVITACNEDGNRESGYQTLSKRTAQFGAILETGDAFLWTVHADRSGSEHPLGPSPPTVTKQYLSKGGNGGSGNSRYIARQVWRWKVGYLAAQDLAIGVNGSILIATRSGHCFQGVPERSAAMGYKYKRIPFLQRITSVFANSSGGYAAVRQDFTPHTVHTPSASVLLASDMSTAVAHTANTDMVAQIVINVNARTTNINSSTVNECRDDDSNVVSGNEQFLVNSIVSAAFVKQQQSQFGVLPPTVTVEKNRDNTPILLSDLAIVDKSGTRYFVHKCILTAASPALARLFSSKSSCNEATTAILRQRRTSNSSLSKERHHLRTLSSRFRTAELTDELLFDDIASEAISLMIIFLYTGALVWPSHVLNSHNNELTRDAFTLGKLLEIDYLCNSSSLTSGDENFTRAYLHRLYDTIKTAQSLSYQLSDLSIICDNNEVLSCHQIVLTSRCPFFAVVLSPTWRARLHQLNGCIAIDLSHLLMKDVNAAVQWCYTYELSSLVRDHINTSYVTTDAYLTTLFDLLAIANELLLNQLKTECESALQALIDNKTVFKMVVTAHKFCAVQLRHACLHYIAVCWEACVEQQTILLLDDELFLELEIIVKDMQRTKQPISRAHQERHVIRTLVDKALVEDQSDHVQYEVTWLRNKPSMVLATKQENTITDDIIFDLDENSTSKRTRPRFSPLAEADSPPKKCLCPQNEATASKNIVEDETDSLTAAPGASSIPWATLSNQVQLPSLLDIQSQESVAAVKQTSFHWTQQQHYTNFIQTPSNDISTLSLGGFSGSSNVQTLERTLSKISHMFKNASKPTNSSLLSQFSEASTSQVTFGQKQVLSQKERKRQASAAASSPPLMSNEGKNSVAVLPVTPKRPAWSVPVSPTPACAGPTLAQIQAEEQQRTNSHLATPRSLKKTSSAIMVPSAPVAIKTKPYGNSIPSTYASVGSSSLGSPPSSMPSWTSFTSIQIEQTKKAADRQRAVTKRLSLIQLEDSAATEITRFYATTGERGTGEWVTWARR